MQKVLGILCHYLGLPPVVNGVVPKKRKKKKAKKRSGHTRGQCVLVPAPADQHMDFLSITLAVMHILYCQHLRPPVEQDTDAWFAVLAVLREDSVRRRIIASVRLLITKLIVVNPATS